MTRVRHLLFVLAAAALAAPPAGAQAPPPLPSGGAPSGTVPSGAAPSAPLPSGPVPSGDCDRCGKIQSIRVVTAKDQWTPLGSVVATSPLAGKNSSTTSTSAVTMVQIGPKLSKEDTVFLGAAGGAAYKSRAPELNAQHWEVTVRMEDGGTRLLTQNYEPMLREGDRVRVMGTQLELVQ